MALDLPAIVQAPEQQQAPPDMARTILAGQQIKQGMLSQQHAADLPGAISAYQGGDKGALAQIYADNPEVANSMQNLALRKQEVNQEGALQSVQMAGERQTQASGAIDLQIKQRDQQLQKTQMQGMAAQSALQTVTDMRNAKADPSQIQDVVKNIYDQYGQTTGEKAHPELADYNANPDMWMKNMSTIAQHGQMAGTIRAQMNMTPEERQFQVFKNMSSEDKRDYLAMQSKDPYALTQAKPAGAEAGAQPQGPTQYGAVIGTPKVNPNQTETENKVDTMNLDPAVAASAKAFLRGDGGAIPGVRAMPAQKMGWQIAQQIDGSLSPATYVAKAASLKAFTSQQESHNLNAALTVVNHVADWADNMQKLDNGGYKALNAVENATKSAVGPDADKFSGLLGRADIAKTAVGSEAAKAYKGTGAITEGEAKDWQDKLSHNVGPETAKANAAEIGDLLLGKLDALKTQWNETHPDTDFATKFIPPKTVATLTKLGVDKEKIQDLIGDKYNVAKGGGSTSAPPAGAKQIGTSGGKAVYQLPDGSHVMEQ